MVESVAANGRRRVTDNPAQRVPEQGLLIHDSLSTIPLSPRIQHHVQQKIFPIPFFV